jgi:hypothetical protein
MRRKRKQAAPSPQGPAGCPTTASDGDAPTDAPTSTSTSSAAAAAAAATTTTTGPGSALHHDITNRAELHANAQHVWSMIQAARPKNTHMAYTPKQKEFQVGGAARRGAA